MGEYPKVPPEHIERVNRLLDQMQDGLTIIEEGRVVFANDRACEIFGRSREELTQITGPEIAAPEERDRLRAIIEEAGQTGEMPDEIELWIERPDGRRCINNRYSHTRRSDGTICLYVLTTDVTERRRSEDALAESERFLSDVFGSIQDGISIVDRDLRILRTNPASERWHPDSMPLVGKRCYEAYHRRQEPCDVCPTRQTLETGKEALEVVPLTGPGGEDRGWIELYSFPLHDQITGELKGVIEYARDITDRRRAELERDHLFSLSVDMLCIAGFDGYFRQLSPAWTRTLGWSSEELLAKPWLELVHAEDLEATKAALGSLVAGETVLSFENRHVCRDGTYRWLSWTASPMPTQELILAVARDITAWKREEEERAGLEAQLRQAQRLEAIGRLAAGVAHDLNNLLTPVIGGTDMVLLDMDAGSPHRQDLSKVLQAAEHARELVGQLLAFGRRQVLRMEPVSLNALIDEVHVMLGRLIPEDIAFEVHQDPELSPVCADHSQLVQVVVNLCLNASDFMPGGGTLTVETSDAVLDEACCSRRPGVEPGPYVLLSVSDTGLGMDEETRARIFEPFFTTKKMGLGTGLGLATVHGIVKQHGGHIWVHSEPGKGTTFKVYLPRAATPPGEEAEPRPELPLRRFDGETVLLVEDNAAVRALAARILERQGLMVLCAGSGDEALAIAEKHAAPLHLLLTDVVLPGITGRELFERLAARQPGLRVLFMSGYTDDVVACHGVIIEGTSFVQKPFTVRQLAAAVCATLVPGATEPV